MPNVERQPTITEIEHNVVFMAYVVEPYGERYAPVLDAAVTDLEAAQRREIVRANWRRIHNQAGGRSQR